MPRTNAKTKAKTPPDPAARLRALMAASGRSVRDIASEAGTAHTVLLRMTNPPLALVGRVLAAIGKRWADLD